MTTWTENNRKKPRKSRCGAKASSTGLPCRKYAMPNGRCRLHGGKSIPAPKGHKRALKHGLYVKGLLEEEKELLPLIKLGSLDEEIQMLKLKLRRAFYAQRLWLEQRGRIDEANKLRLESIETNESTTYDKDGNPHQNVSIKTLKKKEDYSLEIRSLSKLISQLEIRRKELLEQGQDGIKSLVKSFREFADDAEETLPGGGGS